MKDRVLILAFFLFGAQFFLAFGLEQSQIIDLFSQGKEFFRKANQIYSRDPEKAKELYLKALRRFERIAKEGKISNGKLFYNIGNIYFRLHDIGRAILYYRRAQLYIPYDLNLQQNLHYARKKRLDKIEEKQKTKVLKTLFFWHYDLSAKTRLALFVLFFSGIWICASIRLWIKKTEILWILFICCLISMAFFGSLLANILLESSNISGVIVAPEVVARKGDSITYQPSFKEPLHAGTEFSLEENRGEWYYIELPDGRRCWIPSKSAELVS